MIAIDRARALLKSGDRAGAQKILLADLKNNPHSIEAILLLAKTTDSEKQKRLCYERALAIDPANLEARNGLKRLGVVASPPMPQPTVIEDKSENSVKSLVRVEQPKPQPPKVQKPSHTSQAGCTSRTLIFLVIAVILIGCLIFIFLPNWHK